MCTGLIVAEYNAFGGNRRMQTSLKQASPRRPPHLFIASSGTPFILFLHHKQPARNHVLPYATPRKMAFFTYVIVSKSLFNDENYLIQQTNLFFHLISRVDQRGYKGLIKDAHS